MGASWVGPGRGGLGLETGLHYQEVIWHVQRVVVRGRVRDLARGTAEESDQG